MHKKLLLLGILLSSLTLAGCVVPKNIKNSNQDIGFLPPPPPQDMSGPNGLPDPRMIAVMGKKLDEACLSGIMQTGSSFFKELNKTAAGKMEKLRFIKAKLESLKNNASTQSKAKIIEQLDIVNDMIEEMGERDAEVSKNPNIICQKTEELKTMNKNMREKIMGLSGNMNTIREHEKNEGPFQHMKEKLFGEDPNEDFEDNRNSEKIEKQLEN